MPSQLNRLAATLHLAPVPRWKTGYLFRVVVLCGLMLGLCRPAVSAQDSLDIRRDIANVVFPDKIHFVLEFHAPEAVEKVMLLYSTNAQTCQNASARRAIDFEESGDWITAEWVWDLDTTGGLPPGALLHWQWQVTTTSGDILTGEPQELIVEDSRYTWHKAAYGAVTVYWVEGDAVFGRSLQEIGTSSLARLAREVGIEPPAQVRLMVYPDSNSVQAAGIDLPEWTGGFAVPEYSTVMLGIPSSDLAWARTIIPHELAHLVSDQRTFNCKGARMPTWLSEGISTVAEGGQDPQEREQVLEALKDGRLPALRSLANGFAADSKRANLSYAQSGMLARYFITTYGADGMDRLLQGIQDGQTVDGALEAVTGVDTDGLDALWRASLGFDQEKSDTAQPFATRTPRPRDTAIPTLALWTQAVAGQTPTAAVTIQATVLPPTLAPSLAPTVETAVPAAASRFPIWPFLVAGVLLLAGAAAIAVRRTFRR